MIKKQINKFLALTTLVALVVSASSFSGRPLIPLVRADTAMTCSTLYLQSGTGTQTAGWTSTNPVSAPAALSAANYSHGSFVEAPATETVIPPWVDPAANSTFSTGTPAIWVSTDSSWPGGSGNTEGSATTSQWRLFHDSFTLPVGATATSGTVWFTADNAAAVYFNGNATPIATTNGTSSEDVYGATPATGTPNYSQVFSAPITPVVGTSTVDFVVRNWSSTSDTNPTGLLYKVAVNYCMLVSPSTVKVTIAKYVDGAAATNATTSANGSSFSFMATTTASNINSGNPQAGSFSLNSGNSYMVETPALNSGASYTTAETRGDTTVGNVCATSSQPFTFVGYTTGDSLAAAATATPTTTAPSFTGMTHDKFVIVWNTRCALATSTSQLAVNSIDPVKTSATADNTYENGWKYLFHVTIPTNETNLSMKFSDWVINGGSDTIPAGGNMRISSPQADNSGATVPITAANTYSSPALHITGDTSTSTPGIQADVLVEVKIPTATVNGTYSTNYAIQTL